MNAFTLEQPTGRALRVKTNTLQVISDVYYLATLHRENVMKCCCEFSYEENGELVRLPSTKNSITYMEKVYGNRLPVATRANILLFQGVVVCVELTTDAERIEHADSFFITRNMSENVRLMNDFINKNPELDFQYDLNGIFWKMTDEEDTVLTADHSLKGVKMANVFFASMNKSAETALQPKQRYAIAYSKDDKYIISPPIFADRIGKKQDKETSESTDEDSVKTDYTTYIIDRINANYRVNLNFFISSSKQLTVFVNPNEVFDMLGLFELIRKLGTLSLPKLPKSVKESYQIKLGVKDTIIWLLGLQSRFADGNIHHVNIIKRLIKMLLVKSLTKNAHQDENNLLIKGKSMNDIPLITEFSL